MQGERGFLLLEVLIAFVIAVLALAALFQATGDGLRASHLAQQYQQAVVRARSHLAMATRGGSLMPGTWQGDDGGGYHWRLLVRPLARATAHPTGAPPVPLALYGVTVEVSWTTDARTRTVRLETREVGQPVGTR